MITWGFYTFAPDSNLWVWAATVLTLVAIIFMYHMSYMNAVVAYSMPWLMIVFFSAIPISEFYRPLSPYIYALIFGCILTWFLFSNSGPVGNGPASQDDFDRASSGPSDSFWGIFAVLCVLLCIEVALSGFVPLLSLLTTGDSNYMEFGVHSLHGAVLAYANAFACLSFYQYLTTRDKRYLKPYLGIWVIFVLLVTRQNLLTIMVESTVIWCMVRKPMSKFALAVGICIFLAAFSVLGELRSGDITDIIHVSSEYSHLPKAFYWLYAYSYFNVLNLQLMIQESGAPFFDGSMFNQLLPSFIRGESTQVAYTAYGAMAVTSYLDPVYRDVGYAGAIAVTAFWGRVTSVVFSKTLSKGSFFNVASYSCLYYCALISFFVNNWFYLPIISQIGFFWLFDKFLFAKPRLNSMSIAA